LIVLNCLLTAVEHMGSFLTGFIQPTCLFFWKALHIMLIFQRSASFFPFKAFAMQWKE